ncbi:MAG: hypothetical protein LBJ82_03905, partial [Deltaproteobacteria bacterium]|nr:hypothetical protein [Deltaproteobacteria bacterium]
MIGAVKTVLRLLLWLILALVLGLGAYLLCRLANIPPKTALAGAVLLLALLLCLVLCARALARRRRRLQIERVVSLAPDSLRDGPSVENLLDNRWRRAIAILKSSYLGRWGNPVYALPWYMIMGRTGAGKSSAISHCGLNAMQTDVGPEQEHAGTRNCDWYFFRKAVVLDTAGRYAVPTDEAADNGEWGEFLRQLGKYRRKEALNGLVVTIAADTLHDGGDHLLVEARCLRRRLDEIMRLLGAKFPVYLLITKIDLHAGLSRVLESLPPAARQQAAGQLIRSPDKKDLVPVAARIRKALDDVLEQLRLLCLYRQEAQPQPHRLLAWEECKSMMPALAAYGEELFAENPYQETPLLRGIFFSSALRTGAERTSRAFPGLAGLMRGLFRAKESAAGFFLHDFFGRLLPLDRNLNRPVAEYLRWRSSVRGSAYVALLLATLGLAGMYSLSYRNNEDLLRRISAPAPLPAQGSPVESRLLTFEQRFRETEQLEQEAEAGLFPYMGLNQWREGLGRMNNALSQAFEKDLLDQAVSRLRTQRNLLTSNSPDRDFFLLATDLVWRFRLLSTVRQGKSFADLLAIPAMPQGMLHALGADGIPMLQPPAAYSVARYYYNSRADATEQEQHLRSLKAALNSLLETNNYSLRWLMYLAGEQKHIPPLKAGLFWPGALSGDLDEVQIEPAYTADGFTWTIGYLDRLSQFIDDSKFTPSAQEFLRWYAHSYANAWEIFAAAFAQKTLSLSNSSAVDAEAMTLMSSDSNPFFTFALRLEDELGPVRGYLNPVPPWLEDLDVFILALRREASAGADRLQPGLRQRLLETLRQFYETADSTLDEAAQRRHARAEALSKEIQAYLASLRELVPSTLSTDQAFTAVQAALPDENNSNAATAKLALAKTAILALRHKLNPNQEKDSPLLKLEDGPLSFFTARLINSASCHIQAMWEGEVLAKAGGLSPLQLQQGLFAQQGGLARNFADATLKYFFNHTLHGYDVQDLDGIPVPFTN